MLKQIPGSTYYFLPLYLVLISFNLPIFFANEISKCINIKVVAKSGNPAGEPVIFYPAD